MKKESRLDRFERGLEMLFDEQTRSGERLRRKVQALAKGKIKCPCGNNDWRQFLYVSGSGIQVAGCKRCCMLFAHTGGGNWKQQEIDKLLPMRIQ